MLAADIIRKFADRGITISLTPDGDNLEITRFSELTDEEKHYIKCYKPELLWRLKHPDGDPEVFIISELCTVCGSDLLMGDGERYRRVWCPSGHMSGWRPPSSEPLIDGAGDLIIPLDAPEKYHYWQGGQSVEATLKELNAPIIRRRG
jgi:hypothetical protein